MNDPVEALPSCPSTIVVPADCGVVVQLTVLVQDLTQQRAAEEAQRRSQALIDAAVAALPVTLTTFGRLPMRFSMHMTTSSFIRMSNLPTFLSVPEQESQAILTCC